MKSSFRSALSWVLVASCATALWNCASDDPPPSGPGLDVDAGAGASSSSSSSGQTVEPDSSALVLDASDGDAGRTLDEQVDAYLDALVQAGLRCGVNVEAIPREEIADDFVRDVMGAPGVTDAWREASIACAEAIQNDGACTGDAAACLGADSLVGTLPIGSACRYGAQCESGVCPSSPEDACSVCTAALGPGASCLGNRTELCAPNTRCVPDGAEATCRPVALVPEGAACDESLLCGRGMECVVNGTSATCMRTAGPGGICNTPAFQLGCTNAGTETCDVVTNLCKALPTFGQPCPNDLCATGSICDPVDLQCRHRKVDVPIGGPVASADRCVAGASRASDPDTGVSVCTTDAPLNGSCAVANCAPGLVCSESSVCVDRPDCP